MLMKKRCVLTGGAGFLGVNVACGLLSEGYEVIILDKSLLTLTKFPELIKNASCHQIDYTDSEKLKAFLKKGDVLFHFACSSLPAISNDLMEGDIRLNVVESIKLFKIAQEKQVQKIIFPSSGGTVYGNSLGLPINENTPANPICSYGITKLMTEKYLYLFNRLYGIDFLIYRISNPYGPGQNFCREQGLIVNVIAKMLNNLPITIFGDDSMVRDYIYIDDLRNAFILGLKKGIKNGVFNVGTGKGYSIKEIIEIISNIFGFTPKIIYSDKRLSDVQANILNPDKICSSLNWEPNTSIEEGIKKTYKWLKQNIS